MTTVLIPTRAYPGQYPFRAQNVDLDLGQVITIPKLKFKSVSEVEIVSAAGDETTQTITLKDGKNRTFESPVAINLGVSGEGGLDTGSEQANKFYYAYLIPKAADDNKLAGVLSLNPPTTGPTGYTDYRYISACWNNDKKDIARFTQQGAKINYHSTRFIENLGPSYLFSDITPKEILLGNFVPETAGNILISVWLRAAQGGCGSFEVFVDGSEREKSFDGFYVRSTEIKENFIDIPVPNVVKKIFRKITEDSGDLDLYKMICHGWIDEYLL